VLPFDLAPLSSTTLAAARLGRYDMAFSNVLGANLLDMALIPVTDLTYSGPPVLNELDTFAVLGALLAIAVTAVVLAGVIRRRVKSVRAIGWAPWRWPLSTSAAS
jgi:cation:H+ antiporter